MSLFPCFRPSHLPRLLLALGLGLALTSAGPAFAAAPTDADIDRLLAASRAQAMLDSMLPQMEAMQQQQFAQLTRQSPLSDAQQAQLQRIQQRTRQSMRQTLSWAQMRPMYVDLYRKSFSKEDVLAMAEFYESSAGQSLLDKTPLLMQNLMVAIQQKVQPMLSQLQQDLQQIANEPEPAK